MRRRMLKSKIHRATITAADLHYEGSLSLDRVLMAGADLIEYEAVQVVNVNNGARFETYVIAAPENSGTVQLNGAAARLGMPGDLCIIMAFVEMDDADARPPAVLFVDADNRPVSSRDEPGG